MNLLSRVLGTSTLPAATIDKVFFEFIFSNVFSVKISWLQIVNLVSTKSRVSKLEFFVALALVALAQSGKGRIREISLI